MTKKSVWVVIALVAALTYAIFDSIGKDRKLDTQKKMIADLLSGAHEVVGMDGQKPPSVGPVCLHGRKERPGEPKSYCGDQPSLAAINMRDGKLEMVLSGLEGTWAVEFLDDNRVLITERRGHLLIGDLQENTVKRVKDFPSIDTPTGQGGLLDVALHPEFSSNQRIYYTVSVEKSEKDEKTGTEKSLWSVAIWTGILDEGALRDVSQIFVAQPYIEATSNIGGALAFDDEGFLYVTIGDRTKDRLAQELSSHNGTIVRLYDDGAIPQSNPFVGRPDTLPEIYAYGFRNPQGLVFDKQTRRMFEAEHGPMGGDEVNVIEAGKNYGWPKVTYGHNYTAARFSPHVRLDGMEEPLFYYLPSIATSAIAVYRGKMFPEWDGDLFVGGLRSEIVSRLDLVGDRILTDSRIFTEFRGRVRDIKVAPDGAIFVLVENGELWRFSRRAKDEVLPPPKVKKRTGRYVYKQFCSSCHDGDVPAAPRLGDREEWARRQAGGKDALYQATISGKGAMPPRGFCEDCTDKELIATVNYILRKSK